MGSEVPETPGVEPTHATAPTADAAVDEPSLGALRAVGLFALYVAVQLVAGLLVGAAYGVAFARAGGDASDPTELARLVQISQGPSGVAGVLAGGAAVAGVELRRRRRRVPALRRAIGWRSAPVRWAAIGLATGFAAACTYALLAATVFVPEAPIEPGPTTRMALTPGWSQRLWIFAALAVGPPIEEFLFRGVLLAGFERSWGFVAAAGVTTVLFLAMHASELAAYPPAAVGISLLAAVALWLRRRTGALAPAVAAHFGYNLLIVALAATATAAAR